eukprot:2684235-Pleurochrysis_carterae.AAC.2
MRPSQHTGFAISGRYMSGRIRTTMSYGRPRKSSCERRMDESCPAARTEARIPARHSGNGVGRFKVARRTLGHNPSIKTRNSREGLLLCLTSRLR